MICKKIIVLWIVVLSLLVLLVFAAIPTSDSPLLQERTAGSFTNLTWKNQSGADTDGHLIVFNYQLFFNDKLNLTRMDNESNPVAWFPLDQGNSSNFIPGFNDAKPLNAPTAVDGIVEGAMDFEVGSTQSLQIAGTYGLGTGDITMCAWTNIETHTQSRGIVGVGDGGGAEDGSSLDLILRGGADIQFVRIPTCGIFTTSGISKTGEWQHVCGRYNGSGANIATTNMAVFINGELQSHTMEGGCAFPTYGGTSQIGNAQSFAGTDPTNRFFDGILDEVQIYAKALSDEEILRIYTAGRDGSRDGIAQINDSRYSGSVDDYVINMTPYDPDGNVGTSNVNVVPVTTDFRITAKDLYDATALINISVRIFNSSFSINQSTENGTLLILNTSFSFDKKYDITFGSNDTGGYFNNTIKDINITQGGTKEGTLFQSVLHLFVIDGLTDEPVPSFTAITNLSSDDVTGGDILILIKAGVFSLNVTASGFDKSIVNFTRIALENSTLNVSMGSVFSFILRREDNNLIFDVNSTNSTELNVFCPNQTIQIIFNETANATQIINCEFTLMQIVVDYGALGSYFRTLIPPLDQKNITWYLIDLLAGDTAIQRVVTLVDLTGEFADSILTVKRAVGGIIRTIIDQRFDISNEVNLFLVKDALYTISINNGIQDIVLGNLIPTGAGTQTITLPKLDFVPGETTLGGNVSWSYTFNITDAILRMQYNDQTNRTTLVRFTVFNDTGIKGLNQLFQGESQNNASVTITFNQVLANTTYATELFVQHLDLINFTDKKIFYEFKGSGTIDLIGWNSTEQTTIKKWFAWIFLAMWGMFFTKRYVGIGMSTLIIFLWIFKTWNWIEVPALIFGFVALLAVVGYLVDAMRRN